MMISIELILNYLSTIEFGNWNTINKKYFEIIFNISNSSEHCRKNSIPNCNVQVLFDYDKIIKLNEKKKKQKL